VFSNAWKKIPPVLGTVATFFSEKKVAQSPALRDPAFHSFESGKNLCRNRTPRGDAAAAQAAIPPRNVFCKLKEY
jgi:hypothetical protein